MATEIEIVEPILRDADISLTQFWGGETRKICVQISQPNPVRDPDGRPFRYIQLDRAQALAVSVALRQWAASAP